MDSCEALTTKKYKCRNGAKYCINLKGKKVNFCETHKKYIDNLKDYYYDSKKGKLVVNRIARARHDKETGLPLRYVQGLTRAQKFKYKKELQKSRAYYRRTGLVKGRKPVYNSKTLKAKRSSHVIEFEKRYGFKITNINRVKKLFPDTNVDKILAKGKAAYSSGSRPTVTGSGGPSQWAEARLASSLTCGKATLIDKDLIGPKSMKIICGKN